MVCRARTVPKRLSAELPDHLRDWHAERERLQANFADFVFRITEMTLVCGAVVYVERRLDSAPIASSILTAFVAIYARSRATAGLLERMKTHELGPHAQRRYYLIIQVLTFLLFFGIIILTNTVVPLIANVQI